jgi:hypothetical protein
VGTDGGLGPEGCREGQESLHRVLLDGLFMRGRRACAESNRPVSPMVPRRVASHAALSRWTPPLPTHGDGCKDNYTDAGAPDNRAFGHSFDLRGLHSGINICQLSSIACIAAASQTAEHSMVS